ncbi:hypothetical protein [Thermogymnomonas acidicola]|uniref:hypothetical protein n=1 Tax=Thermogymnomonas acidicola TaxID=399579 RepID=UPI001494C3C6|nr:hypothetical protein [Thermogymnomonas acidicola]
MMERSSLGRDVLMISFSAFFADLGYQAVIAGGYPPLYLTVALGAPPFSFMGSQRPSTTVWAHSSPT